MSNLTDFKSSDLIIKASDLALASTITFRNSNKEVALISPDGVFSFTVAATDENALEFVAILERLCGKKITGLDVTVKS